MGRMSLRMGASEAGSKLMDWSMGFLEGGLDIGVYPQGFSEQKLAKEKFLHYFSYAVGLDSGHVPDCIEVNGKIPVIIN